MFQKSTFHLELAQIEQERTKRTHTLSFPPFYSTVRYIQRAAAFWDSVEEREGRLTRLSTPSSSFFLFSHVLGRRRGGPALREGGVGGGKEESQVSRFRKRGLRSGGLFGRRKKGFCGGGGGGSEGGGKVGFPPPPFPRYPAPLAFLEVKTKVGKCGKRK